VRKEEALMNLKEFQDQMTRDLYGITVAEAKISGNCIQCGRSAIKNCYSEAGRKEYSISGLCEECFDSITEENVE
jgi:hypothetical protein